MTAAKLKLKFLEFHFRNPHVWELIKRFALEAARSGRKRLGMQMIIERARWESAIVTTGSPFKLDNDFAAFYSRMFADHFPQYAGIFSFRKSAADGTTPAQ